MLGWNPRLRPGKTLTEVFDSCVSCLRAHRTFKSTYLRQIAKRIWSLFAQSLINRENKAHAPQNQLFAVDMQSDPKSWQTAKRPSSLSCYSCFSNQLVLQGALQSWKMIARLRGLVVQEYPVASSSSPPRLARAQPLRGRSIARGGRLDRRAG